MSRRLAERGCPQVHRRDRAKNPRACGPCGQPSPLTHNTVAPLQRGGGSNRRFSADQRTPPSMNLVGVFPRLRVPAGADSDTLRRVLQALQTTC